MTKLQLLSPAGDFDCLVAAVSNGADAVYLGPKLFNARRLAGNFNTEGLKTAIQYAHLHDVKVFVTLNTLIKNNEIAPFLNQVSIVEQLGADAVILQDLSFAPLIKKHFPNLALHASTQSTIMNSAAVNFWKPYIDIFVLARELSQEQIGGIYKRTGANLETFVHGHLCISYSGQCLISSLIGKRSGNRGLCASSCRKEYNGNQFLLSAKDLCLLPHLQELKDCGIKTIKIEGRMKPAEYVAKTTAEYRMQLDTLAEKGPLKVTKERLDSLKMAFNREFTSGYFSGEKQIVDPLIPSNRGIFLGTINWDKLILEEDLDLYDGIGIVDRGKRRGFYVDKIIVEGKEVQHASRGEEIKISHPAWKNRAAVFLTSKGQGKNLLETKNILPFSLAVEVSENKNPKITVCVKDDVFTVYLKSAASKPLKHPLTKEQLETEFKKYHSKIFFLEKIDLKTDNSFIPKSELTDFRNRIDQMLLDRLVPTDKENKNIEVPEFKESKATVKEIHVRVYSIKDVKQAVDAQADIIYYDAFAPDLPEAIKIAEGTSSKLYLHTPLALFDNDIQRLQSIIHSVNPAGILANNVGALDLKFSGEIILGPQMNIFNDRQLAFYQKMAVASLELNKNELSQFRQKDKIIYYAHGYPAVMTFKEEFDTGHLTDKKGYTFLLRKTSTGATEMLYSRSIGLLQRTPEILDVGITKLYLELESDVYDLVALYKQYLERKTPSAAKFKHNVTIGNLDKGVM
ncbi:MAG: DUF3656 domain-containing protein [Nanoarchaeota archaeon]